MKTIRKNIFFIYKFKQMCYNMYTLWGLIMKDSKVRQYSRKIGINLWVLDYYFKELQENLLPLKEDVKDEEERELLPTTKNTEINLWMIDHYFNELQDNLIPLKIKYMETEDEEEKEEVVHDAIHQIYSTRGIKTMYSETDQEKLEKSILLFKILLEDDNTLDNQVQPELFELNESVNRPTANWGNYLIKKRKI